MAIQTCKAYKTSDGRVHADKAAATQWEFNISIQGFFNRSSHTNSTTFSPQQVAHLVSNNFEEFREILSRHSISVKRAKLTKFD